MQASVKEEMMFSRTSWIGPLPLCGLGLFLSIFLLVPLTAYSQVTLTGAIQFSANSTGAYYGTTEWNTVGSPSCCYSLWLALNPDATSPVNGPSDAQAPIAIPLGVGNSSTYYIFAYPWESFSFNGLNLFFDGNDSTPGISVFGATNSSNFLPNGSSTLTLQGASVAGSGSASYSADGVTVVLTGYDWNTPATPPGDVCQGYAFAPAPGGVADYFGSFTLQVYPAATLRLSQTGGPPGTELTTTASGFAPGETVDIYINHIGGPPLTTTTADANGAFTVSAREPQMAYGPIDIYAVGLTSGKLGAAPFFVSAAMVMTPHQGVPGDTTTAHSLGFGAGETVDIYWGEPRQLLGAATASRKGTSTLTITIPANAPRGPNRVLGVGQTTQATGFGEVVVK
jgi:hypothetical protein